VWLVVFVLPANQRGDFVFTVQTKLRLLTLPPVREGVHDALLAPVILLERLGREEFVYGVAAILTL
jgi:hypothetical protein